MKYRMLGKTGIEVSEVSFGAWAIGGTWGPVDDDVSMKALEAAIEGGINFFDTADVYGDGRSERLLGILSKRQKSRIYIATKAGRKINPHIASGYTLDAITGYVDQSLKNLDVEQIDLLQLHCPPTDVYDNATFFGELNTLIKSGKVANLGVSVETMDEALRAIEYDNVATIQLIFNMFRHKPIDVLFDKAKEKNVGLIARVPLASGLLTGKMSVDSTFDKEDHRSFNRNGEAFDKGETFSGVPFLKGLEAVELFKQIQPKGYTMAQFALAWILQQDAISCVIPGGKTPEQVSQNIKSSELVLSEDIMSEVKKIYDANIREDVHHLW